MTCVCVSDVMQVEVIRTYTAKQPDELSLQVADVVLVSQAVDDGTSALGASASFSHSPSLVFLSFPPAPYFNRILSSCTFMRSRFQCQPGV